MYRIANNESLNYIKKNKKYKSKDGFEDLSWVKEEAYFDGDEAYFKLMQAVNRLPDQQKLIFTMKYFQDLKYREIAEITGLTEGSLKASYFHAVKKVTQFVSAD